jgi:chitodextrinase
VATINIVWNWATNTDINFNAATDILDFGWFAADQFTISEISGTVVIAIPSNHQTYTLQHTTLNDLHLSNIVAKDASAISEWTTVLGNAPVTPPAPPEPPVTPPAVPPESGATTWSAGSIYTTGMTVTENGVTYKANWWTQGTDPAHNNGVVGTGEPWTIVGAVDPSHDVPTVPTGFVAAGTSSGATTLTWNASSVPGNGVVTGYAIFENNHQIATTIGTAYTAANLAADTIYSFAVAALDAAGSSAETSPISVHTAAAAPGGPGNPAHEFSPYIDMAMPADANLSAISAASGIHNFTLAFVLSSGSGIGWQGAGTISNDTLANGTTILSQVQAIQAGGGDVTISFGGAAGQEAALTATSAASLQAEYQSVIDRYHIHSLDFDVEGAAVQDQHSITLRDQALVGLKAADPGLTISYTLPVLPTGLTADGLNVLASAKHDGVKIDVVNIMAMDYGSSVDNGGQMGLDAINAAIATEKQIGDLSLTSKIGVTPMIGVNDVSSEVFTPADAQALLNYAQTDSNVARLSMWSVARDNGNSAGAHYASPDSSGIAQQPYDFSAIFHHFDLATMQPPAAAGGIATSSTGDLSFEGDRTAPQLAPLIQAMAGLSPSAASQSMSTLSPSAAPSGIIGQAALDSSSQPLLLTTPHSSA